MADPRTEPGDRRIVALAGGVGGAKLAEGLQAVVGDRLTVIVNTADDTERHGLVVCADHDTVMYTLAGIDNREWGWGLAGETFAAAEMLERYGEETWFRIGDADLATHVRRKQLMRDGASLTDATASMAGALGVPSQLLPATNDRLRTVVETDAGTLDFQTYFVRRQQADAVRALRFAGADDARPTTLALAAIAEAQLMVIGPSNPLVSIGPILAIPGMREALLATGAARVGVSGIVAGQAIRGPADRMLATLGHEATARGVAALYADLVDRFVIDEADADLAPSIEALGMEVSVLPTVMRSNADRAQLARSIVAMA